jgi:UDP-N-acetylmuramyl pentapeptide phosphotransferase/UDP-N-acetylglucosamine-1-phosphate transferase
MYYPILAALVACAFTYYLIPVIIHVAIEKNLMVKPVGRSSHELPTPQFGGIGIFCGLMMGVTLFMKVTADNNYLMSVLAASVIIFLVGVKDDLSAMSPTKKLMGQVLAASILVFKGGIYISNFHGIFGFSEIPYAVSVPLSLVLIVYIINAINLSDGINGLAGLLSLLFSVSLGSWFWLIGDSALATIALSLAGACFAFLQYNFITPAKTFMGDTGSLLIGLIGAVLMIRFVEIHKTLPTTNPYYFSAAPAMAVSLFIYPIADTLRVFVLRLAKGKSPFSPDRSHIHHMLLDCGLTHKQATWSIIGATLLLVIGAAVSQSIGALNIIIALFTIVYTASRQLRLMVEAKQQLKTA